MPARLRVVAALLEQGGRYLLTQRGAGAHMAGYWEFPGGKVEPGESDAEALVRELAEELGVEVSLSEGAEPFAVLRHDYPERSVELVFLRARIEAGAPRALEVADFGWFLPSEMEALPILPADLPLVARLEAAGAGGEGA